METRKPLNAEQQALATRYLPLARALALPLKMTWPSARDEFASAAMLGLVEAAESFDPERDVKFATFARHRIRGALRDVQRRLVALGWRCDAANAPRIYGDVVESRGRVLGVEPDAPVGTEMEARDEIEHRLKALPPRTAQALRLIYLCRCTQGEAARRIGCSQSRMSFLHQEGLAMLNGTWGREPAEVA